MATVDMPLEELREYRGRTPRPNDFDEYWAASLAEMRSTPARIELVDHPLKSKIADCFDLYFTGVGGARVHAQYLRPRNVDKQHPAVLTFHGYGCDAGEWCGKLNFVSQGFAVASLDVRGQLGESEDTGRRPGSTWLGPIVRGLSGEPNDLLYRQIFLDTAQLAGIVMGFAEVDAARVGSYGGSQGGGLALACAALEPRVKKVVCWNPFLCDYKRVWEMDLDIAAYQGLKDYFRSHDPLHAQEDEIFNRLGYIDVQHLAPRIRGEVLMFTGLRDTICPPSTQFAAYNKIEVPKSIKLYPDFGHEDPKGSPDMAFDFLSDL